MTEDRGLRLAVLALELGDGVEPRLELGQPVRVGHGPVSEGAHCRHDVLDVNEGGLEAFHRSQGHGVQSRDGLQERDGP